MSSEWNETPLVAGKLTGIRAFRVGHSGTLHAVHRRHEYTGGEEYALCQGEGLSWTRPGHHLAGVECSCGFYAYLDPKDAPEVTAWRETPVVVGIIEGYGRVTVGSKGFRCAKARIVALVDPSMRVAWRRRTHVERLARWVEAHDLEAHVNWLGVGFFLTGSMVITFLHSAWGWLSFVPGLAAWWVMQVAKLTKIADSQVEFGKVREWYPHIPVYPSIKAALADHPLSERPS